MKQILDPSKFVRVVAAVALLISILTVVPSAPSVQADSSEAAPGSTRGAASAISAGESHSCTILDGGSLRCWGSGANGRLGNDDTANIGDGIGTSVASSPTIDLGPGRSAASVTTGQEHTCALLDDDTVKCWGVGADGRLGHDDTANIGDGIGTSVASSPAIDLGVGRTALAITAGDQHTCALLDDNSVKCWGAGAGGRLGNGTTGNVGDGIGPTVADSAAIDLGPGRSAVAVAAGSAHTCALLDDNSVKCWGAGADGRLGNDGNADLVAPSSVVDFGLGRTALAITAGSEHTCALLDDDSVKCWGAGADGRLGNDGTGNIGDGIGTTVAASPVVDLGPGRTALAITAGAEHTCALLDDDTVKCWGAGADGRLGNDATGNIGDGIGTTVAASPVVDLGPGRTALAITAGAEHTCALLDDVTVKCWGAGADGRLGNDATSNIGDDIGTTVADARVELGGTPFGAVAIDAGGFHSCVIRLGGQVSCFGSGTYGQLGTNSTAHVGLAPGETGTLGAEVELGDGHTAEQLSLGFFHTCAILDDDSVKCWGRGDAGRLGNDSMDDIGDGVGLSVAAAPPVDLGPGRTATAIAAGTETHTCALLDDGSVKCWGSGSSGKLGNDSTDNIGDGSGATVAASPPVDFGPGRTAKAITAGAFHTCAILDDDSVKCWGSGASGQLGSGATTDIGDGFGPTVAAAPPVDLGPGRTAKAIAAGDLHTCALLDDDTVKCWGAGSSGQLGNDDITSIGDGVGPDVDVAPTVDLGGGHTATAISAGSTHTCAVLDDDTAKCWGSGGGKLGNNSNDRIGDGVGATVAMSWAIPLGAGRTPTLLAAGRAHTCALLDDTTVKCWGDGLDGQLGTGSTATMGDEPGEMELLPPIPVDALRVRALAAAPAAPSGVSVAAVDDPGDTPDDTAVLLSWTAPTDDGGNAITGYRIEASIDGSTWTSIADTASTDTTYLHSLTANLSTQIRVAAINAVGVGPYSAPSAAFVTVPAPTVTITAAPGQPDPSVTSDVVFPATFDQAVTGLDDTDIVLGGDALPTTATVTGSGTTYTITVTGMTRPGDATISIPAESAINTNLQGNTASNSHTIGHTMVASAPSGVSVAAVDDPGDTPDDTAVLLSWTAPTDDGGDAITGYRIEASIDGSTWTSIADTASTDTTYLHSLTANLSTQIRVAAINAVGVGPYSAPSAAFVTVPAPTVTITAAPGQPDPSVTSDVVFTATFDQAVTGLDDTDIVLGGDALPTTATVTGSGTTYTITVTGMTRPGDVTISVPAESAINTNLQGNTASDVASFVEPAAFVTLAPERFVDTRASGETLDDRYEKDGTLLAGGEYRVEMAGRGDVPTDAVAVIVNITAVAPQSTGFVTAHPCITPRPLASLLNFTDRVNLGNEIIAPLSADGDICLFTSRATDLTLDVSGYVPAGSPVVPVTPGRFFDTRPTGETFDAVGAGGPKPVAGSTTRVDVGGRGDVPADAEAVVVNVTVIQAESTGYITVHPCLDQAPNAASLNYTAGVNRGNELIAKLNSDGDLCVFTSSNAHFTADVVGYIPAGSDLDAVGPARLLDTRLAGATVDDDHVASGKLPAGTEYVLQVGDRAGVPVGASSAVINITAVGAETVGFVTMHPCLDDRPTTASLNYVAGVNGGNEIVVRLDEGGAVCLFTSARTHLTADIVAYS